MAKTALPTGARKAAIVIASLPKEVAVDLISRLDAEYAEQVSIEVSRLGDISESVVEGVLDEFKKQSQLGGLQLHDGMARAKELLRSSLPEGDADEAIARLETNANSKPFEFLATTDNETIFACLRDEQPQTVALVLANITPSKAARVLGRFSPDMRGEIVRRIALMNEVAPDVITSVEDTLSSLTDAKGPNRVVSVGGPTRVADILRRAGTEIERDALNLVDEEEPELADVIRKQLFAFEDLAGADDRGIRALLKELSTLELSVALKTASEELREKFMENLSKRARDLLIEDMEYMRPVRLTEVEAAQTKILDAARRLEEAGEIFISGRSSGDEYIG